ncbi:MAG: DUF4440 domain-containing protein [Acidobacteria bacterium]|nr:MAG: DUF4440 domain-containing protein [Acidobacteriota bacterium]
MMRPSTNTWILFLLLCAVVALPACARAPSNSRERALQRSDEADRAAIRAVLNEQVEAWNRGDLKGFMRGYWASDDLTFFSGGTKLRGWHATLQRYRRRYHAEGQPMGHLQFRDLDIQLLGPRSALVRGEWRLERPPKSMDGLFTLIFRKTPRGWKIIHDHTSRR